VLSNSYGISILSWSLPTDHSASLRLLLQLKLWPFRLVFSLCELGKAGNSYGIPSLQVKSFSVTLTAVPSLETLSPLQPLPARISPSTQFPAYPMQPHHHVDVLIIKTYIVPAVRFGTEVWFPRTPEENLELHAWIAYWWMHSECRIARHSQVTPYVLFSA
jgi:hypothetical protein